MRLLIIQTAFIGDAILATSMIEELAHINNAQIDILIRKGNESLFENNPHLSKVLIWDKSKKYNSLFTVIKQIRASKYDYLINLQRFFTTGLITALSNAKHKVGFDKNPLSMFFTKKIPHVMDGRHEIERNHELIAEMNQSICNPKLYPSEKDYELVKQDLPYVTMAPSSVWFTKQLPKAKWIELINSVGHETRVILLGGTGDKAFCEEIKGLSKHPNIINNAGHYSFLQSAALMRKAKMNYVNDSAPLHLASSMNAPVTVFFCSTVPKFGFTPLSDQKIIAEVNEELDCRPCGIHGYKSCPKGHFKCGNNIDLSNFSG